MPLSANGLLLQDKKTCMKGQTFRRQVFIAFRVANSPHNQQTYSAADESTDSKVTL